MSNPSASSSHSHPSKPRRRYQLLEELEQNPERGQIAYLAWDNATQQPVVLKRFVLPQSGCEAYRREIQVLQSLNHPGIPRYLDSFETRDSFCLVQEYKKAESLAVPRSFQPKEIKQIAVSVLEILLYLQNRTPCVIHGDIKPENILVDEQWNVYLVNFRLTAGYEKVACSRVDARRFGFMAPEQLYNRKLTPSTDLYNLGATLICLLTQTKSNQIHTLIGEQDRIKFQHLVPANFSLHFINWLDTMVQPNRLERYPNAVAALEALKALNVNRLPEVKVISPSLEFKATELDEKLTQTITVSNFIPDTMLEGTWKVALHPNDPLCRPGSHAWISFAPAKFESNQAECKITVDTSKLRANQTYKRQIVLQTNSSPPTHSLTLKVQTAAMETKKLPYISLMALLAIAAVGGWLGTWVIGEFGVLGWGFLIVGLVLGCVAGWAAAFSNTDLFFRTSLIASSTGMAIGIFVGIGTIEVGLSGFIIGFIVGFVVGVLTGNAVKDHRQRRFPVVLAVGISILTAALGMSLGIGFKLGFLNSFVKLAVAGTGLPLALMLVYPLLNQAILIAKYLQSERYLIKP